MAIFIFADKEKKSIQAITSLYDGLDSPSGENVWFSKIFSNLFEDLLDIFVEITQNWVLDSNKKSR